jgi:tetratricopeptide (TPR) repeat protein
MDDARNLRKPRRSGRTGRRARRLWCLPPAVTREPGETLEGMHVLGEFPGEPAHALWTALRDVTLWANTPPERRAALFSPGAEARRRASAAETRLDPVLEAPLATLSTVASHAGQASAAVVSLACLEVSRWARARGGMGTAVSFAQAAAMASPDDPAPALAAGRVALEWGRPARAETWLRRTMGLARRAREWESYGEACVSLGEIHLASERMEPAAKFYWLASRVARRQRLRFVRAEAMHGLLRVSLATGQLDEAEPLARAAQRAYGRSHARVPDLLHDVTELLVRRGEFERVMPLLRRQLAAPLSPGMRMACLALLARAAASLGDAPAYEQSWMEAWALRDRPIAAPHLPGALRHLGRAAERAHDWLRVQQAVHAFEALPPEHRRGPLAAEMAELAELVNAHRRST